MARNPWPAVVMSSVLMVCVTFLAYIKADTSVLIGLAATAILPMVTMIYGSVEQTRAQTNGNNTQLASLVRELSLKLAESTPAAGSLTTGSAGATGLSGAPPLTSAGTGVGGLPPPQE